MAEGRTVLWWGRFDPGYSRNRILRRLLREQGWTVLDFRPALSGLGEVQAALQGVPRPDLVWVPCFRQRDLAAASRWARRHGAPLVFDPLISAYDKQVDERHKLPRDSRRARRLLQWERGLFARADRVVADTPAHAGYFHEVLGVPRDRLAVLMVGAEEGLFRPCPECQPGDPLEILFYGSFIPLQGPEVIVEAARLCRASNVVWTLLGNGPLRPECERLAEGLPNVRFEDWLSYEQLPGRLCRADILLGIFGDTPKAGRVIPNKVYQALACAKPLVTRAAPAYPGQLLQKADAGIDWVPPADPVALAKRVERLVSDPVILAERGRQALTTAREWFGPDRLTRQLQALLAGLA